MEKVQYLAALNFSNDLPEIPFEPKFLSIPTQRGRFYKYRHSSLEQNFQYEIHVQPSICPTIMMLRPPRLSVSGSQAIDKRDAHLLRADDKDFFVDSSRYKAETIVGLTKQKEELSKFVEAAEKARSGKPWLLKTQYLDNDLGKQVHKYKSEFASANERRKKFEKEREQWLHENQYKTRLEKIKDSFEAAASHENLLSDKSSSKQPVKVWNVAPWRSLDDSSLYQVLFTGGMRVDEPSSKQDREGSPSVSGVSAEKLYESKVISDGDHVSLLFPSEKAANKVVEDPGSEPESTFIVASRYNYRMTNTGVGCALLWHEDSEKDADGIDVGTVSIKALERSQVKLARLNAKLDDAVSPPHKRRRHEIIKVTYEEKETAEDE